MKPVWTSESTLLVYLLTDHEELVQEPPSSFLKQDKHYHYLDDKIRIS